MEATLVRKGLMEIVTRAKAMPNGSPNSKAVIAFTRMQAETCAEIILHLKPSQLLHIHSCNLTVIWDELEAIH